MTHRTLIHTCYPIHRKEVNPEMWNSSSFLPIFFFWKLEAYSQLAIILKKRFTRYQGTWLTQCKRSKLVVISRHVLSLAEGDSLSDISHGFGCQSPLISQVRKSVAYSFPPRRPRHPLSMPHPTRTFLSPIFIKCNRKSGRHSWDSTYICMQGRSQTFELWGQIYMGSII